MSGSSSSINNTGNVSTGNSVLPPPRLTGNAQADAVSMQRWLNLLYDEMIVVGNITGRVTTAETNIATLQTQVATLQAQMIVVNTTLGIA